MSSDYACRDPRQDLRPDQSPGPAGEACRLRAAIQAVVTRLRMNAGREGNNAVAAAMSHEANELISAAESALAAPPAAAASVYKAGETPPEGWYVVGVIYTTVGGLAGFDIVRLDGTAAVQVSNALAWGPLAIPPELLSLAENG